MEENTFSRTPIPFCMWGVVLFLMQNHNSSTFPVDGQMVPLISCRKYGLCNSEAQSDNTGNEPKL